MDVSEATRTVGGHSVRIYATDGGSDRSIIHGAIYDAGGWQSVAWDKDGEYFKGMLQNENYNLDLTDWRDLVPWEWLTDKIEWVARDAGSGAPLSWFGYECMPERGKASWIAQAGQVFLLRCIKMPDGPVDWREAIAKRPDNSNPVTQRA